MCEFYRIEESEGKEFFNTYSSKGWKVLKHDHVDPEQSSRSEKLLILVDKLSNVVSNDLTSQEIYGLKKRILKLLVDQNSRNVKITPKDRITSRDIRSLSLRGLESLLSDYLGSTLLLDTNSIVDIVKQANPGIPSSLIERSVEYITPLLNQSADIRSPENYSVIYGKVILPLSIYIAPRNRKDNKLDLDDFDSYEDFINTVLKRFKAPKNRLPKEEEKFKRVWTDSEGDIYTAYSPKSVSFTRELAKRVLTVPTRENYVTEFKEGDELEIIHPNGVSSWVFGNGIKLGSSLEETYKNIEVTLSKNFSEYEGVYASSTHSSFSLVTPSRHMLDGKKFSAYYKKKNQLLGMELVFDGWCFSGEAHAESYTDSGRLHVVYKNNVPHMVLHSSQNKKGGPAFAGKLYRDIDVEHYLEISGLDGYALPLSDLSSLLPLLRDTDTNLILSILAVAYVRQMNEEDIGSPIFKKEDLEYHIQAILDTPESLRGYISYVLKPVKERDKRVEDRLLEYDTVSNPYLLSTMYEYIRDLIEYDPNRKEKDEFVSSFESFLEKEDDPKMKAVYTEYLNSNNHSI